MSRTTSIKAESIFSHNHFLPVHIILRSTEEAVRGAYYHGPAPNYQPNAKREVGNWGLGP